MQGIDDELGLFQFPLIDDGSVPMISLDTQQLSQW